MKYEIKKFHQGSLPQFTGNGIVFVPCAIIEINILDENGHFIEKRQTNDVRWELDH